MTFPIIGRTVEYVTNNIFIVINILIVVPTNISRHSHRLLPTTIIFSSRLAVPSFTTSTHSQDPLPPARQEFLPLVIKNQHFNFGMTIPTNYRLAFFLTLRTVRKFETRFFGAFFAVMSVSLNWCTVFASDCVCNVRVPDCIQRRYFYVLVRAPGQGWRERPWLLGKGG